VLAVRVRLLSRPLHVSTSLADKCGPLNVASGATIVLVASSFFFAALAVGKFQRQRPQRKSAAVSPRPATRTPET